MQIPRSLIVVLLVSGAAACSTTSDPGPPDATTAEAPSTVPRPTGSAPATTGTAAPATSPPATITVESEVADAYVAAVSAEFAAYETADESHPELLARHLDPVLTELKDRLFGMMLLKQVSNRPDPAAPPSTILGVTVNGDRAEVEECTVDDSVVTEPATGRVINNVVVSIHRSAVMVNDAGTWKLSERTVIEELEGSDRCADLS